MKALRIFLVRYILKGIDLTSRVIRLFHYIFAGFKMTEASLDKVYAEVKRVHLELKSIEKTLESLVESLIPEEQISPEERKELREIEKEMERGECVSLEEI